MIDDNNDSPSFSSNCLATLMNNVIDGKSEYTAITKGLSYWQRKRQDL